MARSPSNKGITNRNANVPPAGRNYQDQSQAVRRIPDVSFGEQQELTEQQKAICYFAEKLTLNPGKIDKEDIHKIKEFGYVDKEVSEIVQIISYFNYINRVADGLGLEPEDFIDEKGYKK